MCRECVFRAYTLKRKNEARWYQVKRMRARSMNHALNMFLKFQSKLIFDTNHDFLFIFIFFLSSWASTFFSHLVILRMNEEDDMAYCIKMKKHERKWMMIEFFDRIFKRRQCKYIDDKMIMPWRIQWMEWNSAFIHVIYENGTIRIQQQRSYALCIIIMHLHTDRQTQIKRKPTTTF